MKYKKKQDNDEKLTLTLNLKLVTIMKKMTPRAI